MKYLWLVLSVLDAVNSNLASSDLKGAYASLYPRELNGEGCLEVFVCTPSKQPPNTDIPSPAIPDVEDDTSTIPPNTDISTSEIPDVEDETSTIHKTNDTNSDSPWYNETTPDANETNNSMSLSVNLNSYISLTSVTHSVTPNKTITPHSYTSDYTLCPENDSTYPSDSIAVRLRGACPEDYCNDYSEFQNGIAAMAMNFTTMQNFPLCRNIESEDVDVLAITSCGLAQKNLSCVKFLFKLQVEVPESYGLQLNSTNLEIMWNTLAPHYFPNAIIEQSEDESNAYWVLYVGLVIGIGLLLFIIFLYLLRRLAIKMAAVGMRRRKLTEARQHILENEARYSDVSVGQHPLQSSPRLFDSEYPYYEPDLCYPYASIDGNDNTSERNALPNTPPERSSTVHENTFTQRPYENSQKDETKFVGPIWNIDGNDNTKESDENSFTQRPYENWQEDGTKL